MKKNIIDNFEILKEHMQRIDNIAKSDNRFAYDSIVWYLQILKRNKDNPGQKGNSKVIKNFYFSNAQEMMDNKERIIDYCEKHNARAYLRPSPRLKSSIIKQVIKDAIDCLDNCKDVKLDGLISKASGRVGVPQHFGIKKFWTVDIDTKDREFIDEVKGSILSIVYDYMSAEDFEEFSKSMFEVPTKNGVHVICKPFNLNQLDERFSDFVDIHKDNPTILYCNT